MKRFTVDRFEGEKVVLECENGEEAVLDRTALPKKLREGDVLHFEAESCYLDREETECRSRRIRSLMETLMEE